MNANRYLTTKQAAEYLNIPVQTIRYYIHKKKIKHYKTGNGAQFRTFFKPEDLDNFLVCKTVGDTPEQKANEYIKLNPTERMI